MAFDLSSRARYVGSICVALAIATCTRSLRAQTEALPPPLTPPHALDAGTVPYPVGASTEASVVVELVVDSFGNVQDARVVDGEDPFARAVLDAAPRWKFDPAHRGDTTVAARVRMRVFFRPPAPRPTPSSEEEKSTTSDRAISSGKNRQIDEVEIFGEREEPGEISIGSSEVRQIPGAFGDPFRAVDSFPGVTPIASGVPFFFVRGAPPGDTGYFLDGIRLPLLFHVGVGPSVVQPGLVDRMDFYPANFPAQYGRSTGGVIAATTMAPKAEPHGEANLRFFDAGGFAEAPFSDGRGTALVGGRYSYTAPLLAIFAPDTHLDYWDYQTRVTWKLDARDEISAFALGSHDYLGQDKLNPVGVLYTDQILGTDFHRLDLRWDRTTSEHAHLRVAATLGIDSSSNQSGSVNNKSIALRTEYDDRISSHLRLRLGADVEWDHYGTDNDPGGSDSGDNIYNGVPISIYVPRNDVTGGVRADVVWRILPRVEIVPGLRADVFTSRRVDYPKPILFDGFVDIPPVDHATAVPALDPRISVRVFATKNVSYFSALGLTHQVPSSLATLPGVNVGGLDSGLQSAIQTSQGVDIQLPFDISARATAFYSHFSGLTDATATCTGIDLSNTVTATNPCVRLPVGGRAYGAELLVRRSFAKRISGWLSYTLSRSTREASSNESLGGGLTNGVLSEYDRTHVLTLAAAYDFGKRWRAGARFYYYTGRPYSPTYQGFPVAPYNSERLPDFWRVDVRLEKSWRLGKNGQIAFVVEGLNVTLNKEVVDVNCPSPHTDIFYTRLPPGASYDKCTYQEIGPVTVPSLGLEGSF